MEQAKVLSLDPKEVKVGWRARKDLGDVSELAKSIDRIGQIQPILVRINKKGIPVIIAGMRRLTACKQLKREVNAVVVKPKDELHNVAMQLEENIKRKDFDKLEVGEGLARYKKVYEKKHPETKLGATLKQGLNGGGSKDGLASKENKEAANKFVTEAALMLGISERLIYQLLEIGNLPEEEKAELDKAKTSKERNVAARKAIKKVATKKKEEKLREKVVAKRKAAAKEKGEELTEENMAPPVHLVPGDYNVLLDQLSSLHGSIDLLITDPPYEVQRSLISHSERGDINECVAWDELNIGWVMDFAPFVKQGGSVVAFCPLEAVGEYEAAFKRAGLVYRGAMIWKKSNPAPTHRKAYVSSVEAIVWATNGANYHFEEWENAGDAEAHNLYEGAICSGNERLDHPTQKPLWLMRKLIKRHSQFGDVILDPFVGSGTTLVACKELCLEAWGVERDSKYVEQAKLRLEAL